MDSFAFSLEMDFPDPYFNVTFDFEAWQEYPQHSRNGDEIRWHNQRNKHISFPCGLCRQDHNQKSCPRFAAHHATIRYLTARNSCILCGGGGHSVRNCQQLWRSIDSEEQKRIAHAETQRYRKRLAVAKRDETRVVVAIQQEAEVQRGREDLMVSQREAGKWAFAREALKRSIDEAMRKNQKKAQPEKKKTNDKKRPKVLVDELPFPFKMDMLQPDKAPPAEAMKRTVIDDENIAEQPQLKRVKIEVPEEHENEKSLSIAEEEELLRDVDEVIPGIDEGYQLEEGELLEEQ